MQAKLNQGVPFIEFLKCVDSGPTDFMMAAEPWDMTLGGEALTASPS
jgi:hypothetical protein